MICNTKAVAFCTTLKLSTFVLIVPGMGISKGEGTYWGLSKTQVVLETESQTGSHGAQMVMGKKLTRMKTIC